MNKKDILLEIRSYFDDSEVFYMISVGKLWQEDNTIILEWDNPEESPFADKKTILAVKGNDEISLFTDRYIGNSSLILEKGKRSVSQGAEDPFSSMPIGHSVNFIKNTLGMNGGQVKFSYTTDSYDAKNITKILDVKVKNLT